MDIDYSISNTLCATYFIQEDAYYVDNLRDKFEETRSEVSLGQEIVTEFNDSSFLERSQQANVARKDPEFCLFSGNH